jgi:2-C-methyl-D-erythritol 4-phosphate cytidylyltransferase
MIDVIYLTAGQGKRAKLGYPKQFARLGGRPIMVHGLEVLQKMKEIGSVIIVVPPGKDEETAKVFTPYINAQKLLMTTGGKTRQQSVANALKLVTTEYVLITEAVRPFITAALIRQVIDTAGQLVTPWINPLSTAIDIDGNYYERMKVGQVQMPQKVETRLLKQAHALTYKDDFTDDVALIIEMTEIKPVIVPGIEENIKITSSLDLKIAEAIYQYQMEKKGE